jgi:CRP/FNR family transcriptional regulator
VRLEHKLALGGLRYWRKHEALFRAGDPMGPFYKIRTGIVAVSHITDDGRRQIIALRAPGDCVGYLDSDGTYAFEGDALTDVEACAFNRRRFDAFAAQHSDLAAAVDEALSGALIQAGEMMFVLGKLRSTQRVAYFHAEISALYAERHLSAQPLSLHMSLTDIADYLGLSLETVSRSMSKLKKRNIIALVESDAVVILDHARLRTQATKRIALATRWHVSWKRSLPRNCSLGCGPFPPTTIKKCFD